MRRAALIAVVVVGGAAVGAPQPRESVSIGTSAHGSLQGGVSLPVAGDGFVSYSRLGNWLGRQYVNSRVRDVLLGSFKALRSSQPDRVFVVGETGLRKGGRFRPHRTHQNGLSVDIFMPVRNTRGERTVMPTAAWHKFGYSLEFDANGTGEGLAIDFISVADLLAELSQQSRSHGLMLERIIIAPEYVDQVLAAGGRRTADLSRLFMRKPVWVRHDEHIHVDFRVADATR